MGTSPTTIHPIYNQLPHHAYHLLWKAHEEAPRGLPSPLGGVKNGMHYCTL